jgi:hypothetical protein
VGGSRWSFVGKTGAFVLKRLAKFVGSKFIDDLGVFFTEFNDILGGFRQRAEETFALLRQPHVGFVLVASPEPMAVGEALAFHERLTGAGMPFVGFVVNKVHPPRPIAAGRPPLEAALAAHPGVAALGLSGTTHRMAAQALAAAHGELETLAAADREAIGRMRAAGGARGLRLEVALAEGRVARVGADRDGHRNGHAGELLALRQGLGLLQQRPGGARWQGEQEEGQEEVGEGASHVPRG